MYSAFQHESVSRLRHLAQVFLQSRMGILVQLILFLILPMGDLEGLLGSVVWGLKAENPCFGIIVHILTEMAG